MKWSLCDLNLIYFIKSKIMTRSYQIFILLFAFLVGDVESKTTSCRARFKDNKFDYCTKFGSPSNSEVKVSFKSRLLNHSAFKPVASDVGPKKAVFIEFGVYTD